MGRSTTLYGLTRREFFGTPGELAKGLVALFAPPLFMGYALDKYPTLYPNPRLLFVVPFAVIAVAWIFFIVRRKTFMPWGERAPSLMWGGTLVLAFLLGMVAVAVLLIANSVFDRSAPTEIRSYITGECYSGKTVRVAMPGEVRLSIPFEIPIRECLTVDAGDSVRLTVRSGALGMAWIEAHSFVMAP